MAGYTASQLMIKCSIKKLKELGCTDYEILHAGYSLMELITEGYSDYELEKAGYKTDKVYFVMKDDNKQVPGYCDQSVFNDT